MSIKYLDPVEAMDRMQKFYNTSILTNTTGKTRIYRYMSTKEFNLFNSGITITGKNRYKANTNSQGVCFLAEQTKYDNYTFTPHECYRFLSSVVDADILVCFETNIEPKYAYGVYNNVFSAYGETISIEELNFDYYNNEIFIAISYQWIYDDVIYYC